MTLRERIKNFLNNLFKARQPFSDSKPSENDATALMIGFDNLSQDMHPQSGPEKKQLHNMTQDSSFDNVFSEIRSPAKLLPPGWEWVKYNDGSGHLEGPQGQQLFSYDLAPYANVHGVEFQETRESAWAVFWNDAEQGRNFWKYAEEQVLLLHTPQQEFPSAASAPSYEPEM